MATFEIYYGATKPVRAVGVNQCNLLRFAEKYKGPHTYMRNRATIQAVKALEAKGYLLCDHQNKTFCFQYPKG
jgi:hypothetical protein